MNGNGHRRHSKRLYYWVCAIEKVSGRPFIDGPYDTEAEANQFGFAKVRDGDFEVYAFDTVNKFSARDKFKHKRLEQSGQLADVFMRARYKI